MQVKSKLVYYQVGASYVKKLLLCSEANPSDSRKTVLKPRKSHIPWLFPMVLKYYSTAFPIKVMKTNDFQRHLTTRKEK